MYNISFDPFAVNSPEDIQVEYGEIADFKRDAEKIAKVLVSWVEGTLESSLEILKDAVKEENPSMLEKDDYVSPDKIAGELSEGYFDQLWLLEFDNYGRYGESMIDYDNQFIDRFWNYNQQRFTRQGKVCPEWWYIVKVAWELSLKAIADYRPQFDEEMSKFNK